jgi:hypothetical protein
MIELPSDTSSSTVAAAGTGRLLQAVADRGHKVRGATFTFVSSFLNLRSGPTLTISTPITPVHPQTTARRALFAL